MIVTFGFEQILIRGVVGRNYASDIAIDDVTIAPIGKSAQTKFQYYHFVV